MLDMFAKGRGELVVGPKLAGEKHPRAKLTQKQVDEIRRLSKQHSNKEVAERFGINQSTVSRITSGKRWANAE